MYKRKNCWYSDFVFQGERYVKSHGPINKKAAKDKDRIFRVAVLEGTYKKEKDNPRFDKALDEYLKRIKVARESGTYKTYEHKARYLKKFFGSKKINKIENNQVLMRKYLESRKKEVMANQIRLGRTEKEVTFSSINRELAIMRAMYNELIKAGKAVRNPVSLVKMFREPERETILSEEEEDRLFEAIDKIDCRGDHLKDVVLIGLHTGMRRGEILGIHKSWVNFKESVIVVPRNQQKIKKKDKRVPINSEVKPIIERLIMEAGPNGYLFENLGTGKPILDVKKSWLHALKLAGPHGKLGVDRLRIHDLRHTAATRLMRNTGNMKLVARYLGHTDIKTTARYLHPDDNDLALAAESLVKVPSNFTTGGLKQSFKNGVSS